MTLTIIRPSIVGCSYYYPMPGWLDSVSASAAIFLFAGLGILKHLNGNKHIIGDNVPVDFVSDFTIVVAAVKANTKKFDILNCSSSSKNPLYHCLN